MSQVRRQAARGFSLVELLAVVLILSVLAATAIPLYMNTRKVAAARACKANLNAVATAESAFVLRNGAYTDMNGLVAAGAESLSSAPKCPLDGSTYTITTGSATGTAVPNYVVATSTGGSTAAIWISCPDAAAHLTAQGSPSLLSDWQRTMPTIVPDSLP